MGGITATTFASPDLRFRESTRRGGGGGRQLSITEGAGAKRWNTTISAASGGNGERDYKRVGSASGNPSAT